MINKKEIQKIIENNYAVLKGFEVADGEITLSEYLKHMNERTKINRGKDD